MQHPLFDVPRQITRWHHERIDGNGYPDGLKGEEIPLEARITFVSDAYEAMTSDRSYRNSLPPEQAFDELKKNAGTQFDPDIVKVLCELLSPMVDGGGGSVKVDLNAVKHTGLQLDGNAEEEDVET